MRRLLAALMVLAIPVVAHADWDQQVIRRTDGAVFDFTNSTTPSGILAVQCSSVLIHFVPDLAGAETVAQVHVQRCASSDTDTCRKILVDRDGDGLPEDEPLTGNETLAKAGYTWVQAAFVRVTPTLATSGGGVTARVTVLCRGDLP